MQKTNYTYNIVAVLASILLMTACVSKSEISTLQTGDLLFQINESDELIDAVVNSTISENEYSYSNVGILIDDDGEYFVLGVNTVNGVEIMQLETFLNNSAHSAEGHPMVVVKRLVDTAQLATSVERAKTLIGLPFDFAFLQGNDAIYASELVHESYLTADGKPMFSDHKMYFRDSTGNTSPLWIKFFAAHDLQVPVGEYGTNPNDMAKEKIIHEVYRFF